MTKNKWVNLLLEAVGCFISGSVEISTFPSAHSSGDHSPVKSFASIAPMALMESVRKSPVMRWRI